MSNIPTNISDKERVELYNSLDKDQLIKLLIESNYMVQKLIEKYNYIII